MTPVAVGQVTASAHTTVSYRFANGTQAEGDFRIDATTGAITYVGSGEDYEAGNQSTNTAPDADISTDITQWHVSNGGEAAALASMVDGNKNTGGNANYAVHPLDADGKHITFALNEAHQEGSFLFYNRTQDAPERIDGSTVTFRLNGADVHSAVLDSANAVNHVITVDAAKAAIFDEVKLVFAGDLQNFREIEIMAEKAPVSYLDVQAVAGDLVSDATVTVNLTDINETPNSVRRLTITAWLSVKATVSPLMPIRWSTRRAARSPTAPPCRTARRCRPG